MRGRAPRGSPPEYIAQENAQLRVFLMGKSPHSRSLAGFSSANSLMKKVSEPKLTNIVSVSVNIEAMSVEKDFVSGKVMAVCRLKGSLLGKIQVVWGLTDSLLAKRALVFRLKEGVSGNTELR
jgi:hypothetical protein